MQTFNSEVVASR